MLGTEWAQVIILDAITMYQPKDSRQAKEMIERVSARLSHVNSAVVVFWDGLVVKMATVVEEVVGSIPASVNMSWLYHDARMCRLGWLSGSIGYQSDYENDG